MKKILKYFLFIFMIFIGINGVSASVCCNGATEVYASDERACGARGGNFVWVDSSSCTVPSSDFKEFVDRLSNARYGCTYNMLGLKFFAFYSVVSGNTGVKYIMLSSGGSVSQYSYIFDDLVTLNGNKYYFAEYMYGGTSGGINLALPWSSGYSFNTNCPTLNYADETQIGDANNTYRFSFSRESLGTPEEIEHTSCDGDLSEYECNDYKLTINSCPNTNLDCGSTVTVKMGINREGTEAMVYYDGACTKIDLTASGVANISIGTVSRTISIDKTLTNNWEVGYCPVLQTCDRNDSSASIDLIIKENTTSCDAGTKSSSVTGGTPKGEDTEGSSVSYTCEGLLGGNAISFLKSVLHVIMIAGPILALVLGTYDLVIATSSGEDDAKKKGMQKMKNRLIAAVLLLLVPYIVDIILSIAGRGSNCL